MKISSLCVALLILISQLVGITAHAATTVDPLNLSSVKYSITRDALTITYTFDQDVATVDQSSITYHKIQAGSAAQDATPKSFDNKTGNSIIFSIPSTFYSDADGVEFFITVRKSDGSTFSSPKTFVDVSATNRLRKILANQPTLVRYSKKLIEADNRIGVQFTTDKPGKIKVTISGLNSFSLSKISKKVDTTHDFIFDNLSPGQPFSFKAEALQIDDDNQVIPDINDDPAKVGISFKTTNNGNPSVTVDPQPKVTTDNVVFTVRSNQEVYAEIAYTPISQTGVPDATKRKLVGSINCDPDIGTCSGPESVPPDNTPKNFTLPNLDAGTTYKIELAFKNKEGRRATLANPEYTIKIPTPAPTTAFDFSEDAINAKVTPLGIEVKWTATDTPLNASAVYLRDDLSILTGASKPTISGKSITVLFPADDVAKIIGLQSAPILELSMDKGGALLKRRIKFSFTLPTKQEVQQSNAPQMVKDAAMKLIDAKANGSKSFKWTDLLKAGLSIFMAL
jgi:hypothetical protein